MKKIQLIFIIFFFSISAFSQNVSVVLLAPSTGSQGQEFEISFTVNKDNVTGFARLQLDMPEGFTVKAKQTSGATFSFKDNKIRFLWMSLPEDRTLNVSCLATAGNTVTGNIELNGSFSYVLNNETERFTIPSQRIGFEGNASSEVADAEAARIESAKIEKERQEQLAKEKEEHDRLAIEQAEKEALEEAEKLAAQYKETQNTEETPEPEIKTMVIEDNTENTLSGTSENIDINQPEETEPVVDEPVVNEPIETEIIAETITQPLETPVNNEPETDIQPVSNNNNYYEPAPSASTSNSSVLYKIQVGAFKSTPASGYFRKLEQQISEYPLSTSSDPDGYIRYYIGSFNNFSAVDNFHKRVKQLGYISFITARKDGKKITIKEAKAITN